MFIPFDCKGRQRFITLASKINIWFAFSNLQDNRISCPSYVPINAYERIILLQTSMVAEKNGKGFDTMTRTHSYV